MSEDDPWRMHTHADGRTCVWRFTWYGNLRDGHLRGAWWWVQTDDPPPGWRYCDRAHDD